MIPNEAYQIAVEGGWQSNYPTQYWQVHALDPDFWTGLRAGLVLRGVEPTFSAQYYGERFCNLVLFKYDVTEFWRMVLPVDNGGIVKVNKGTSS